MSLKYKKKVLFTLYLTVLGLVEGIFMIWSQIQLKK